MTIENNKQTKNIRESLAEFLNQLKEEKIKFNELVDFAGGGLPFNYYLDIDSLDKAINKYEEYKSRALQIINETRPVLEQHLGYKEILGNLILLIVTLGAAFIVNKVVNDRFLFFQKTNSSEHFDKFDQSISQLSL